MVHREASQMNRSWSWIWRRVASVGLVIAPGAVAGCLTDPTPRFGELVNEIWEFQLREDPLLATSAGDTRYNDRLPSVAEEDQERRAAAKRDFLERLERIERARLAAADRVSYDV